MNLGLKKQVWIALKPMEVHKKFEAIFFYIEIKCGQLLFGYVLYKAALGTTTSLAVCGLELSLAMFMEI